MPIVADMELDTSTAEGFSEGMRHLDISVTRAAMLIGAPESTIKKWLKGERPVHPTAARMLRWMLDGYRPENWHMTGKDLRLLRDEMGLTLTELAVILDIEDEALAKFESDFHGPPGFVATAVRWLLDDLGWKGASTDNPAGEPS